MVKKNLTVETENMSTAPNTQSVSTSGPTSSSSGKSDKLKED